MAKTCSARPSGAAPRSRQIGKKPWPRKGLTRARKDGPPVYPQGRRALEGGASRLACPGPPRRRVDHPLVRALVGAAEQPAEDAAVVVGIARIVVGQAGRTRDGAKALAVLGRDVGDPALVALHQGEVARVAAVEVVANDELAG